MLILDMLILDNIYVNIGYIYSVLYCRLVDHHPGADVDRPGAGLDVAAVRHAGAVL